VKKIIEIDPQNLLSIHHLPSTINFEEGTIILVNKPLDWTSYDVVNKIKFSIRHNFGLKKIKIGHAGTLDPRAIGLLIICTGKYTKLLDQLSLSQKGYRAHIKLGATTASYDSESEEENIQNTDTISDENIINCIESFKGVSEQVPPIFSAIKINGKNAYTLARRGQELQIKARSVEIKSIENIKIERPQVSFDCLVSKGTYIRSLAHDIGQKLECGAYLTGLHRTEIEQYKSEDALEVDKIVEYIRSFVKIEKTL
jgi:tRNA pseudouridine55 synthase